jgi:hypothetical protein
MLFWRDQEVTRYGAALHMVWSYTFQNPIMLPVSCFRGTHAPHYTPNAASLSFHSSTGPKRWLWVDFAINFDLSTQTQRERSFENVVHHTVK